MKLTIVGPNLPNNNHETMHVHVAGCGDLKRGIYKHMPKHEVHNEEHDSVRSLVEGWFGPEAGSFYGERWAEEDIPADAWKHYESEFWFAPCVKGLPDEVADPKIVVMVDVDIAERAKARTALIGTANKLRECLSELNWHGAGIGADRILGTQQDGCAWGEVYDGYKILMRVLFPDDGIEDRYMQIIDVIFEGADDIEAAARHVADANAPKSHYSTSEVREELARYRVYLTALLDNMLDVDKLIGRRGEDVSEADHMAAAERYLLDEINECVAALAYRNEPEVSPDA